MRFHRFYVVGLVALALLGLAWLFPIQQQLNGTPVPHWANAEAALLGEYCTSCHDDVEKKGGLSLASIDFNQLSKDAEVWEKVVRKVRTGMMPPNGEPRPRRPKLDAFASGIEERLDEEAAESPNPGSPALHRLNRTEYGNVIRDLLALDVDEETLLPADDTAEGFDNIADVLGVSPSLIQGYVSAAMKISRQAVGDRTMAPSRVEYRAPSGLSQDAHIEGLPLGTRGGMQITHNFPLDAEYEFTIAGGGGPGGPGGPGARAGGAPSRGPEMILTMNGTPLRVMSTRKFRIKIPAGPQTFGAALVDRSRSAGVDDIWSVYGIGGGVQSIVIMGPFSPTGTGETPSRRKIFVCYPKSAAEEPACAQQIVANLATHAFRRPVQAGDAEFKTVMGFYEQGRKSGDFEDGIQQALARVLVDPRFLFRFEKDSPQLADGAAHRIDDVELASRLSFFLWSSIPDEELLQLAAKGKLSDPKTLEQQTRRMLADPRAEALVHNFAGQWLHLRELENSQPDTREFDENLRQSFQRETELLFASVVRENRSIVDLLSADYTFVDERLARHYGIPDIRGSYFRQVKLAENSPRRGLLGQGSILTVTSVADRTSPVGRGKWVLENMLGTPPPLPPPGVETNLDQKEGVTEPVSLRARMEEHRTSPVCSSCHQIMDPIGFALENFDLIGKWRDVEGKAPVDASGEMVDGSKLNGPASLRTVLLDRSDAFVMTVTEKLLTYALGRGVQYYDMPTVREIVREAEDDDYRFSALVLGVTKSMPFQMRVKKPAQATPSLSSVTTVAAAQGQSGSD